jgi:hypothetical protein
VLLPLLHISVRSSVSTGGSAIFRGCVRCSQLSTSLAALVKGLALHDFVLLPYFSVFDAWQGGGGLQRVQVC